MKYFQSLALRALALVIFCLALAAQPARDVTEFTLFKQKSPIEVAGVPLHLKDAQEDKQRFKLVIVINNKQVEFKDANALVPIYFYTSETQRAPYELVVTRVAKDQISGRLVSPLN